MKAEMFKICLCILFPYIFSHVWQLHFVFLEIFYVLQKDEATILGCNDDVKGSEDAVFFFGWFQNYKEVCKQKVILMIATMRMNCWSYPMHFWVRCYYECYSVSIVSTGLWSEYWSLFKLSSHNTLPRRVILSKLSTLGLLKLRSKFFDLEWW